MRTSQKIAGIVTTIGIDIGKNTFQHVGFDQRGPCGLFSRMGVRVIRTVTRYPASPDTDAEKPGLDIAPCPHPSPGVFSFALDSVISPPRILRPVDCETIAHQPLAQIDIAD